MTATVDATPDGVSFETVAKGDERLGQGGVPFDRVAAQAFTSMTEAAVLTVAKEAEVAEPIFVRIVGLHRNSQILPLPWILTPG